MTNPPFGIPANPMANAVPAPVVSDGGKPDLPKFLLWVAESYEAHANATDVPDEIEGYLGSAKWAREHLAELTAALAKPTGPSSDGWLPIENAPKDGTVGLGVTVEAQRPTACITWFDGDKWLTTGKPEKFVSSSPHGWWPTHWRPLPAAPTEGAAS